MPAEANDSRPASDEAVVCKELLCRPVRVGEELSKAMRIHCANRKGLPAREGWVVVDNGYMLKNAPDLRWFCGGGWWTLESAFVFNNQTEAHLYAQSYRCDKKPDVEYVKIPASTKT